MEYYREQARAHKKDWTIAMIQGGKKHEAQRRDAIAGLASGSVQVIMFVDVLGEGVDVPVCVGLQWIRKTTSLVNYLQFTGRILRPLFPQGFNQYASSREQRIDAIRRSPKPYGVILDHAGNYYTHGHPVIERTWGLDDTRTGRAVEQSAPVITTCPVCNSVWPGKPSKCPACGAVIEEERDGSRKNPEVIKGMLREVVDLEGDDLDRLARFTQNLDGLNEEERRKKMLGALRYLDRDRMRAVAQAVGYKKNWTDTMYRRLNIKAPAGGKR
jgi:superfamily II DNA or RNA helicase